MCACWDVNAIRRVVLNVKCACCMCRGGGSRVECCYVRFECAPLPYLCEEARKCKEERSLEAFDGLQHPQPQ